MKLLQGCLFPALVWLASTVSADDSINGDQIGDGASTNHVDSSQNAESYEVRDYTITTLHDNGYRHAELFLYAKRKKEKAIICGDDLYQLDE